MTLTSNHPASCRTPASAANPAQTTTPTPSEAACHDATATNASETSAMTAIRVQSSRRDVVSSRSSSDGFTERTCISGTTENRSDTSIPTATPCVAALQDTPYWASARIDVEAASASGIPATVKPARNTPSTLPASPNARTCSRYTAMI